MRYIISFNNFFQLISVRIDTVAFIGEFWVIDTYTGARNGCKQLTFKEIGGSGIFLYALVGAEDCEITTVVVLCLFSLFVSDQIDTKNMCGYRNVYAYTYAHTLLL